MVKFTVPNKKITPLYYYSPSLLFFLLLPHPAPAVAGRTAPCALHGGSPPPERRAPSMEGTEPQSVPTVDARP